MSAPAQASPSTAELIAPHLPLLRRYARAISGAQESGDAYVAATLEAIIADRTVLDRSLEPRTGLFKVFHGIFDIVDAPPADDPVDGREAVARERLITLAPRARHALLLSSVEGFSADAIGRILTVETNEAESLIAAAVEELKRQTRARVLIIEDEPIIAMDIESIVADLGHEVVDMVDTADRAVAAAMRARPDLILADIQLADGSSGLDAVKEILEALAAPVVFITAFPERLLTGSRPEPTYLISKPFRDDTLQATISQALFFREAAQPAQT